MPRAEYDVQKGAPTPADTSFRSCVLAILIFIFLCLVLVLLAVGLRWSRSPDESKTLSSTRHHPDPESEKAVDKDRFQVTPEDEDIETNAKTATTTTATTAATTTTTTTAASSSRPTSGTRHPNVTTAEAAPAAERNASSEESEARTVAVVGANAITDSPGTASPDDLQPATSPALSSREPVAQTTHNHSTTLAAVAAPSPDTTLPPSQTNATTPSPAPPPTVFISPTTSDVPPSYLPSSNFPIIVDQGHLTTSSVPHSTASNTTTESLDTVVSLHITSSSPLGPRDSGTDRSFLASDSTNDSSTPANSTSAASPVPADGNQTTKSFTSSTTTTTTTTIQVVDTATTDANATENRSGLHRLIVLSPSEERTTLVTETSTSQDSTIVTDEKLIVATNDSSLMTTSTEASAAGVNLTRDVSPTAAEQSNATSQLTTAASTSWTGSDNSSESTLFASTYVLGHITHSVTSAETTDREAESVSLTTTQPVTAINRTTTAASSGRPTSEVSALQPIVPTTPAPVHNVCRTDACYRQAQRMAAMMNHTVQPCRSFYVAACGGLQSDPLLQEYDPQREAFLRIAEVTRSSKEQSSAIKKLQEFEESCMQYDIHMADEEWRFAEARKVMNNIGNFSFDNDEWKDFRSKFADLFSTLIKYNSSPLFDVLLDVESKNKPIFVFKLVPPLPGGSPFSGDRRVYECRRSASQNNNEPEVNMDDRYFSYKKCVEEYDIFSNTVHLVKKLGYFKGANETAAEKFNESLTFALMDLHKHMKSLMDPTVWQQQFTKDYELAKVAEMDSMFPLIDWKKLFMNLVEDHHESIGEQVVQIYSINNFRLVFEELATSANREHAFPKDLNNALLAYAAQRLVEDFVQLHSSCDREAYCQYVAYSLMSQAASSAYLQSFTAVDLSRMEERARATFTRLTDTLNDEFKNAKWLDEESKTEVFELLGDIKLAPYNWESFLLNNTYLDDYYKELNINRTNYFQNAVSLVLLNKKHSYSLYLKNPLLPQYIWSHFKYPYQHTGNVIYALSTVVIPIGLLSKFSNDAPLPDYINMAGEGLVMAHELAHMFDFVGMRREFNKDDLKLSSHSSALYMGIQMCINSEYDFKKSHPAEDGNVIVFQTNGALSANERMADYTGMLIAYRTYLKYREDSDDLLPLISNWTPDQLFFLQATQELCSKRKIYHHFPEIYEDVHLPSAIRVENMVSNSDEFSEAFNCPKKFHCDVFPRIPELGGDYPVN